jgi:hypothetical protein
VSEFDDDARLHVGDTEIGRLLSVEIKLDTTAYSAALTTLTSRMVQFNVTLTRYGRRWARLLSPRRRSGHRHYSTRAWRLRYAMASDAPLGNRTAAKLRDRP